MSASSAENGTERHTADHREPVYETDAGRRTGIELELKELP